MIDREALEEELIRLHNNTAHAARLTVLHEEAATLFDDPGAKRFQLTHAWVFALVAGDDARAARLEQRLRSFDGI